MYIETGLWTSIFSTGTTYCPDTICWTDRHIPGKGVCRAHSPHSCAGQPWLTSQIRLTSGNLACFEGVLNNGERTDSINGWYFIERLSLCPPSPQVFFFLKNFLAIVAYLFTGELESQSVTIPTPPPRSKGECWENWFVYITASERETRQHSLLEPGCLRAEAEGSLSCSCQIPNTVSRYSHFAINFLLFLHKVLRVC